MTTVMKFNIGIVSFLFTVFSSLALADSLHSKYKDQENREIKSLSADDISELQRGGGWGLAKAAELNGVLGPVHILEMEKEINLNNKQKAQIQQLYNEMNIKAVELGKTLIELEKKLNHSFSNRDIDQKQLVNYVSEIEQVRAKLRIVHLSTHLQTPKILSEHQIALYNKLRGYGSADPCENIPKGHNSKMWKKHNGCT